MKCTFRLPNTAQSSMQHDPTPNAAHIHKAQILSMLSPPSIQTPSLPSTRDSCHNRAPQATTHPAPPTPTPLVQRPAAGTALKRFLIGPRSIRSPPLPPLPPDPINPRIQTPSTCVVSGRGPGARHHRPQRQTCLFRGESGESDARRRRCGWGYLRYRDERVVRRTSQENPTVRKRRVSLDTNSENNWRGHDDTTQSKYRGSFSSGLQHVFLSQ